MPGPAPAPSKITKLRGNPGKRAINDAEPKPEISMPTCPTFLGKEAKKEFRRVAKELHKMGLLTQIDRTALAAYANAFERWIKANAGIEKYGLVIEVGEAGYMMQSPYVGIANAAAKEMKAFLTEFGMTPSARTRIKVEPAKAQNQYENFQRRTKNG